RVHAPLLASDRALRESHRAAAEHPHPGRGSDPLPRPEGPAGPALSALRPSRHDALLRPCRGGGHSLLLSWLAVRREGPLPRSALRARGRPASRPRAPALVSGRGALRPRLGLYGPAREEACADALGHARCARAQPENL